MTSELSLHKPNANIQLLIALRGPYSLNREVRGSVKWEWIKCVVWVNTLDTLLITIIVSIQTWLTSHMGPLNSLPISWQTWGSQYVRSWAKPFSLTEFWHSCYLRSFLANIRSDHLYLQFFIVSFQDLNRSKCVSSIN